MLVTNNEWWQKYQIEFTEPRKEQSEPETQHSQHILLFLQVMNGITKTNDNSNPTASDIKNSERILEASIGYKLQ